MITFDLERPEDTLAVESLLDAAFGLNRFDKASYQLRVDNPCLEKYSALAREGNRVVGTVRYTAIRIVDLLSGKHQEAVLLGPLAIAADKKEQGIGAQLLARTMAQLSADGHHRVLLVGDIGYYDRFGFEQVLPSYITLPGGRDARRLLVRQARSLSPLPAVGKLIAGWGKAYTLSQPVERAYLPAA